MTNFTDRTKYFLLRSYCYPHEGTALRSAPQTGVVRIGVWKESGNLSLIDSLALQAPQVSLPLSDRAPASLRVVVSRRVAAWVAAWVVQPFSLRFSRAVCPHRRRQWLKRESLKKQQRESSCKLPLLPPLVDYASPKRAIRYGAFVRGRQTLRQE